MTTRLRMRSAWQSTSLMVRRRLIRWLVARPSLHGHARFAVLPRDSVSEEVLVAGLYEESLLVLLFEHLLVARRGEFASGVALDIGANIGNHSVFMARYFARVLSFEPNPTAQALLRCNLSLAGAHHVQVFPVGLANTAGTFEFKQNQAGNLGASGFAFAGPHAGQSLDCEVIRGDELLSAEVLGGPLRLVKLDVEGAELAALEGLASTLRQEQPLVLFECNQAEGEGGGLAVFALLRQLGYVQFLAVQEETIWPGRVGRLLTRLLHGEHLRVRAIDAPDKPPYSLLVAVASGQALC
jgi:FkbM family methyltransferase